MAGKYMKRVFVDVAARTDKTGTVHPTSFTLDGRNFVIDEVKNYQPENSRNRGCVRGDCYSIVIKGHEKHLYYLRSDPRYDVNPGRWFVLQNG